ncbi:MAG: PD-(D/E)XK nuclease family protein, partial [Candidatus Cloacimonetes bacterium]|nr:PD-(D/E)XK nuclease family protein [Candidatus Cloacimonadota bacterium]
MKLEFLPFTADIIQEIIGKNKKIKTCYILPTIRSKKKAILLYQPYLSFNESSFFTMEEWKCALFPGKLPLLKDESRSLALYHALQSLDKDYFRIPHYTPFSEFTRNFFAFWEELNEELINDDSLLKNIEPEAALLSWQQEMIEIYIRIRKQYENFLNQWHYSDILFLRKKENFRIEDFIQYERIALVNQFYFTDLEKYILNQFTDKLLIYYQLPESLLDKATLSCQKEIEIKDISPYSTESITIYDATDAFSMISYFLNNIDEIDPQIIVDFNIQEKSYTRFLSPGKFELSARRSFCTSSLYRVLQAITNLLLNTEERNSDQLLLFSLSDFLNLCLLPETYLLMEIPANNRAETRDAVLDYIYTLIEDDYKYIDTSGELLLLKSPETNVKKILQGIFDLLNKIISEVDSISDLNVLFSNNGLLSPAKILSKEENDYTDFLEVFYQSLSDFTSLNILPFLDYENIFPVRYRKPGHINKTRDFLHYFLSYLSHKYFNYNSKPRRTRRRVSSLQDTCDLSSDNVIILNLIEGTLPASPHPSLLLTEKQRKRLGLKTYDDIKARDKYYFYRLIFQSKKVHLFSWTDPQNNVEASSYLEELLLQLPRHILDYRKLREFPCQAFFQGFVSTRYDARIPDHTAINDTDFYTLKFNQESDLPDRRLILSFYRWQDLKSNPFMFFLKHIIGIEPRRKVIEHYFSEKLIGNITHEIMQKLFQNIISVYSANRSEYDFSHLDYNILDKAINKVIFQDRAMIFRKPADYSDLYLKNIFLPIVKNSIFHFWQLLHSYFKLSHQVIFLKPEKGAGFKEIFYCNIGKENPLEVVLTGRADLQIELENNHIIFDYKTGSASASRRKKFLDQLLIYELIYYLISDPQL